MSNVIEIEHIYKEYRLGLIGYGTLREDLQSWWARARGKEDPNSIVNSNDQSRDGRVSNHILALNDINLEVKQGDRLGIIGANGAGKTTLLKILARVASPTKGTVRIKGCVASLIAVGSGFHGELTGRENIYLNGSILGLRKFEIDQRFDEIVDFAGVGQFIDTPVKRYSSGMGVRLGFAVAAHLDPEILIVDEVLAVGDAEFRKKALGKMKDVSEGEGRTILFVSHNMQTINSLCPESILLDQGKIIKSGITSDVVSYYLQEIEAVSIGPEINFPDNPQESYQILGFSILDDKGNPSDSLDRTKHFTIAIDYVLRKPSNDLSVQFSVTTASNENGVYSDTSVLQWGEKHYRRHKYSDEKVDKTPGRYKAHVNFPGYLLNTGKYKLCVHLVYTEGWYEFNKDGIVFELYDPGSSHTLRAGRSAGLLAMPLDWENVNLSEK